MNQAKKLSPGFIATRNKGGGTHIRSRNANLEDYWVVLKQYIRRAQEKILHLAITVTKVTVQSSRKSCSHG